MSLLQIISLEMYLLAAACIIADHWVISGLFQALGAAALVASYLVAGLPSSDQDRRPTGAVCESQPEPANSLLEKRIGKLEAALRAVRAYIKDCDHEPALDEIDAALNGAQ